MIVRTWHGRTRTADADAYAAFLERRAVPDYASVPGLEKLFFLRRTEGDVTHFLLVTVWRSSEAMAAFAGGDVARAKYYPEDDQFLLEKEPQTLLYELFAER
jgi:heme-degrading monooxygenase HmoA